MRKIFPLFAFFLCLFALNGCKENSPEKKIIPACEEKPALTLAYAQNFSVDSCGSFRILQVQNGKAAPVRWLLKDSLSPQEIPPNLSNYPQISIPAKRIVALSSTYLGFLSALQMEKNIVGIDTKKYIADSAFFAWADSVQINEVGEGAALSPEKIYALNADAIFAFSMGESIYDAYPKLAQLKMPVILTSEWIENSPLAKAEWLKFFGILTGKESRADSLFAAHEKSYREILQKINAMVKAKPIVFTGSAAAGTWYASTGKSFMAHLIQDAGGIYLWANDSSKETLSMPFEKAFSDVQKADIWLNAYGKNLQEILAGESRVKLFPVWKTGEIYGYNLRQGPAGGLDFYESAVVKPDSLLLDVAKILHPAYFQDEPSRWYRKLSNF